MEARGMKVEAERVHGVIGRYMQAESMDLVVDFQKSRNARLHDARSGRTFIDFFSFYSTLTLGFNHPRLAARDVQEELGRVAAHKPSNSDAFSRELAGFVEAFGSLARPPFMRRLFFVEGGALAVENALKAAFDWKVRKNFSRGVREEKGYGVIHFQQAFHGRSGYTLSLTNTADSRKTDYFPKFNWPRIVNPKCTFPLEEDLLRQVIETEHRAFRQIEEAIAKDPEDVACIILEPIQGEGGDNHFRPEFHQGLRRLCDENDILLIYDEVQTGFGPTGKMWAFEHYVEPDLLAFGKKTQVCGFMAGPRLDEVDENVFRVPSRINSTWGGNLVDMVRCRIYLEILQDEKLLEHCRRMGALLLQELRNLHAEFPGQVSNARGLGLFCSFDLPDGDFRSRLRRRLFKNGLIILPCGERSLRFRTVLDIEEECLREGLSILRRTLEEFR